MLANGFPGPSASEMHRRAFLDGRLARACRLRVPPPRRASVGSRLLREHHFSLSSGCTTSALIFVAQERAGIP